MTSIYPHAKTPSPFAPSPSPYIPLSESSTAPLFLSLTPASSPSPAKFLGDPAYLCKYSASTAGCTNAGCLNAHVSCGCDPEHLTRELANVGTRESIKAKVSNYKLCSSGMKCGKMYSTCNFVHVPVAANHADGIRCCPAFLVGASSAGASPIITSPSNTPAPPPPSPLVVAAASSVSGSPAFAGFVAKPSLVSRPLPSDSLNVLQWRQAYENAQQLLAEKEALLQEAFEKIKSQNARLASQDSQILDLQCCLNSEREYNRVLSEENDSLRAALLNQ